MGISQVGLFYGDTPPAPVEGTVWINQANGITYICQNGRWVEGGTALRGATGQVSAAPTIYAGSGVPTVVANAGSIYTRTEGSAAGSAHIYYNASAGAGATWYPVG